MRPFGLVVILTLAACGDDDSGGPPTIVSRTPDDGADNVYVSDPVTVVFSEAIAAGASVTLSDGGGRAIEHSDGWSADRKTLTAIITNRPAAPTGVTITISGAADDGGHVMPDETWSWQLPMWQQPGEELNVDPAMRAGGQRLAVDSQRRLVVAWQEADRIRVKRLTGSTWDTLGDALGVAGARAPGVAIDSEDRPIVAWVEGGTAGTITIQAARWEGSAWVALPSPGSGEGLAMAADGAGTIYVAMQSSTMSVSRLSAQGWEDLGGPAGSGSVDGVLDAPPGVALAIAGTIPVVAWVIDAGAAGKELHSARLAAGAWETLPNLNRLVGGLARYPDMTVNAEGRAVIAWEEFDGVSADVHVATLATNGSWTLLGRPLDVDLLDDAHWPGVAAAPDGTLFVTWSELRGPVFRVWVARLQPGGDWEFVGGQALNPVAGSYNAEPRVAVLERWPVVAWWEYRDDDFSKVWVRRYNGNDVRLPGLTARPTTAGCVLDASATLTLSQTGCFTVGPDPVPDPGLIPFDINSQLWSDGALKRRWIVLPDGQTMQATDVDGFTMPVGTMIIKEFALYLDERDVASRRPIETRFLVKRDAENNWEGFSFQWSDDSSDATLLPGTAATKDWTITTASGGTATHTHTYPGRDQCLTCHVAAANVILGITRKQLARYYDYGGVVDQELEAMDRVGLFASPLQDPSAAAVTRPSDVTQTLESRARGYMAANCAHCHRPGGPRPTRDLRWETPLASTMLCDGSEIIPGSAGTSVLYQRISTRPGMPPLATLITDPYAVYLINGWISGMTSCP